MMSSVIKEVFGSLTRPTEVVPDEGSDLCGRDQLLLTPAE